MLKQRLLIQTPNLIRRTQFSLNQNILKKNPKTETACKILLIYAFDSAHEKFGV